MKRSLTWMLLSVWLAGLGASSSGADIQLEAQLIWGTNEATSPDASHKPVGPTVRKKLGELPLKWANYFEVKRVQFAVSSTSSHKETLSDKCEIEVKNLGGDKVEVTLYGKGQAVLQRSQPLPKGEILVLGGNAPNATAWFVTLKRRE